MIDSDEDETPENEISEEEVASGLFRRQYVTNVGDNSVHAFLDEQEWACVLAFPKEPSNRAANAAAYLEYFLDAMAREGPNFTPCTHFAFQGWHDWTSGAGLTGEPAKFKLYKKGQLVAEIDDSILLGGGTIENGKFIEPAGYNDLPEAIRDPVQAIKHWLLKHDVSFDPKPIDRELWRRTREESGYAKLSTDEVKSSVLCLG